MKIILSLLSLCLCLCSSVNSLEDSIKSSETEQFSSPELPGYGGIVASQKLIAENYKEDRWILSFSYTIEVSLGRGCWIDAKEYLVEVIHTDSNTVIIDSCRYLQGYYWRKW